MRKITSGLLLASYLFLALTVSALIWRAGFGLGNATAAFFGALGVGMALHALVTGSLDRRAIRREVEAVRQAHRLLADAMENTQNALSELAQAIETGALSRTEELTTEVRMLESLVTQISEGLEAKLAAAPAHPPGSLEARLYQQQAPCCARSRTPWPTTGWTCTCSRWSPCPSGAPPSMRASPACATAPVGC
ncbi:MULTISPECIES: hypothetical protein [Brevundimonas]|uniref:hypothetical protein n=1 Tax=Brevundimonas TaxID=41275 RepID=UPI0004290424|nr:hypothetical protein [Brevundimonas abyssalis]